MANKKVSADTVRTGIGEITIQGDLLYKGASDLERLPKGTAAQALVMNAGATAPEWADAAGGPWTAISSGTYNSAAASLDVIGITGNIRVIFSWTAESNWDLYARVSNDGGSTWESGGSAYNWRYSKNDSTSLYTANHSAMKIGTTGGVMVADVVNSAEAGEYTSLGVVTFAATTSAYRVSGSGTYKTAEVTNGVQFLDTGGSRMIGSYAVMKLNV